MCVSPTSGLLKAWEKKTATNPTGWLQQFCSWSALQNCGGASYSLLASQVCTDSFVDSVSSMLHLMAAAPLVLLLSSPSMQQALYQ